MKKVILVDGNNLLFRSYYATAYTGNVMRNSKGFPTNGLYGLVNMLNKIIKEENPQYMLVAFDKGKTFRHEKFKDYKGGRNETPDDLKVQFKVAKELVPLMGIKCFEIDNYEADDIIGTYSKMALADKEFDATIISSDKDLLQLINEQVDVKLLKMHDYIRMDEKEFVKTYGIKPIRMIDLKGLMGDASDNIPGVKGIGEKTALKLLQEYESVEGVYEYIEEIKGATKQKLIDGKDSAFESKEIATIYNEVPVEYTLEELKYETPNYNELKKLYEELEFYSFLKNMENISEPKKEEKKLEYKIVEKLDEINLKKDISMYIELDETNYHSANIIGISLYDGESAYFLTKDILLENPKFLDKYNIYTYDVKKSLVALKYIGIDSLNCTFDSMIASYLLNYNEKDDISVLSSIMHYDIMDYDKIIKSKDQNILIEQCIKKAIFIFETKEELEKELKEENQYELFENIELKLAYVLSDMEFEGVRVDSNKLSKMGEKLNEKLEELTKEIYDLAGEEFNIQSPKQLGEILFDKLEIPYPKKKKTSYSTAREILDKIEDCHPIVPKIIEYRTLIKIYTTYVVSILNLVKEDGKLHTIYTQTLTRTGRLSSIEPNLQNIPIRYEEGKMIRKAFVPEEGCIFLSSDYSQIELRIFAHMSNEKNLIDAFNSNMDIHTKTAMDVFHVPENEVTSNMRRQAKVVNFGILYGMSNFGLAEDLGIDFKSAKKFIDDYLAAFPNIGEYKKKVLELAYKDGYVKTIMNRKRTIDELKNTNYMIRNQGERMAINTPIQGSSADILKKAMIDIYEEFNKQNLKSKMILQVHDELIFNVLKEEEEKVKKIVIDLMENAYKLNVPLKVEVSEGDSWYDAK